MLYSVDQLKIDQSKFSHSDFSTLLISNINIPERFVGGDGPATAIEPILQRVKSFIESDYREAQPSLSNVSYQVVATYQLRHNVSGAIRKWTGSFMPGRNLPNALQEFKKFGPDFIDNVASLCDRDLIVAKLKFWNVNTKWSFDRFTSIVINVQGPVSPSANILTYRNLQHVSRRGRGNRAHTTFLLP